MRQQFTLFTAFPLLLAVYYTGCDAQVRSIPPPGQAPVHELWRPAPAIGRAPADAPSPHRAVIAP
jgi:hypothetical protein